MKELLSHTHVSKNDFITKITINFQKLLIKLLTIYNYNNVIFIFTFQSQYFYPMLIIQTVYYIIELIIHFISLLNHYLLLIIFSSLSVPNKYIRT